MTAPTMPADTLHLLCAGAAQGLDVELKVAARLIKRDQGARLDLLPVFQSPGPMMMEGLTMTAFSPSSIPRHTSRSAPYLLMNVLQP